MVHVIALVAAALPVLAQPTPRVTELTAARNGHEVVVTVSLTGGATAPAPRLLEGPWRLYFDVAGVLPGNRRLVRVEAGPVSQIRLALNQPSPPVTRVVIDLTRRVSWRVETSAGRREIRVVIADVERPLRAGTGGGPPGVVMYALPADPAPARDRRAEIQSQLFAMGGVLQAMRAWTGPSDAELATLIATVAELSTGARAMQITGSEPDRALVAALDALASAADARAKALADGSAQSRANAIAAAGGALVLLHHAQALSASR
ncbi:MAG TPA: AMIN domain-containing protein [Vicinamibacterales bacterium]|nr:AMIN domain-containing protein [Vicinamibacterales bacterium]